MQDVEFTVQEGQLFMLQCRTGKRTGQAAIAIACDFIDEGLASIPHVISTMVEPTHLDQLLHPQFVDVTSYADKVIGKGLPASPGAAGARLHLYILSDNPPFLAIAHAYALLLCLRSRMQRPASSQCDTVAISTICNIACAVGQVVFDSATAEDMAAAGVSVILLRAETSPEDVKGMHSAAGVLTQLGGMTSHAAVVARGWGKPCITGCTALSIDDVDRTAALGGATLSEGDVISLNGATGEVVLGAVEVALPQLKGDVARFMEWVDGYRTLGVLANADTPADAKQVRTRSACCCSMTHLHV